MATTRIIPMHLNKGKTLAQCLADRTEYGMNPDKTEGGALISAFACEPETAVSEFALSKREYRQHQKAERFKVGSEWMRRVEIENGKTVDNDLLFTRWNGQPLDPNAVTSWFPGFLAAHDLPAVHFHSLRHTNASLLIAAHVPVTTVSGRLGHAKTSTTTDIYAGFIRSSDAAAADALTDVFSRIKEKTHA